MCQFFMFGVPCGVADNVTGFRLNCYILTPLSIRRPVTQRREMTMSSMEASNDGMTGIEFCGITTAGAELVGNLLVCSIPVRL